MAGWFASLSVPTGASIEDPPEDLSPPWSQWPLEEHATPVLASLDQEDQMVAALQALAAVLALLAAAAGLHWVQVPCLVLRLKADPAKI